jgi:hypothetical protein
MDPHAAANEVEDQETLAALLGLLSHLRADVAKRQREWETLGAELEAKGRRLRLVEATVELLQRREDKEVDGGNVMHAAEDEDVSQEARVSMGCHSSALYPRHAQHVFVTSACTGALWLLGRRQASAITSTARSCGRGPASEPCHGAAAECVARPPQAIAIGGGGDAAEGGLQGAEGDDEGVVYGSRDRGSSQSRGGAEVLPCR